MGDGEGHQGYKKRLCIIYYIIHLFSANHHDSKSDLFHVVRSYVFGWRDAEAASKFSVWYIIIVPIFF